MKPGLRTSAKPTAKQRIKPAYIYAAWALAGTVVVGLIIFFYFGRFENAFAGSTYNTTTTGGDWATNSTWTPSGAPANWGSNTANLNGNVTLTNTTTAINGFTAINLNNGKSFTSGTSSTANDLSMQSVTFNVVNGNIIVYGNLTLNNTTLTITTGSLTVTGTLTLTGNSVLTSNSTGSINVGAISTSGSGGTLNLNSGSLSVTNAISISSGTTIKIASGATASAASFTSTNNADAVLNNAGTMTITGNLNEGGVVNNTGTMNIGGSLISSGSSSSDFLNSGTLNITGSMTLPSSGTFSESPGGATVIGGNINVTGNQNIVIGTNVAPPAYADLVVKGNLNQSGSGDVLFNRNARVAIYGNVVDNGGGGTLFTVNQSGQVYINGNIIYTGGGDAITNNNGTNPYGLYVNGTTTNSGGGSTTTSNSASKSTMQSTNVPFSNWVSLQSGSPLPVSLVSFTVGDVTTTSVALAWSTASEENLDKFVVERSSDEKSFAAVGEVNAAGNSKKMLHYNFTDETPATHKLYYRLKSVDLDGKYEYSKVIVADVEGAKEISIYPNPSNGQSVNFSLNFDPQEDDVIAVFDNSGREVMHGVVNTLNGQIVFDEQLKPGIYIVKYSSSNFKQAERLVVR